MMLIITLTTRLHCTSGLGVQLPVEYASKKCGTKTWFQYSLLKSTSTAGMDRRLHTYYPNMLKENFHVKPHACVADPKTEDRYFSLLL